MTASSYTLPVVAQVLLPTDIGLRAMFVSSLGTTLEGKIISLRYSREIAEDMKSLQVTVTIETTRPNGSNRLYTSVLRWDQLITLYPN